MFVPSLAYSMDTWNKESKGVIICHNAASCSFIYFFGLSYIQTYKSVQFVLKNIPAHMKTVKRHSNIWWYIPNQNSIYMILIY